VLFVLVAFQLAVGTAQAEKRIALVIGNAGYQAGALNTPANDAGLIAQTLQASGFDVAGARDLDQDSLRRAFRDFLDKASASGPDTVALIYLAGYGLQLEGENYFVPDRRQDSARHRCTVRSSADLGLYATACRTSIESEHRGPRHGAREPVREVGPAACGWLGVGRAGTGRADSLQRRAGHSGAGRTGTLWALCPGSSRDDA
jgi:hypothetical protein